MITKSNLKNIRIMAFVQVMNNVKSFLAKENLETLNLMALATVFNAQLSALEEAIKPLRKNENTAKIKQLDHKRDTLLMGFIKYCRLFQTFPEEASSQAAKKLIIIIEKYGKNPQKQGLREETAIIRNLLADLEVIDLAQAVTTIGATKWLEHLKTTNAELEKLHTERTEEQSAIEVGKTKAEREKMQEAFDQLVIAINGLSLINGKEKYQNLINAINLEIKEVSVK